MAADALAPYDIDYIEYVGPSLTWGSVLSTCVKSMWRNDIKCKYMFMFPQKNLARKGLRQHLYIELQHLKFENIVVYWSLGHCLWSVRIDLANGWSSHLREKGQLLFNSMVHCNSFQHHRTLSTWSTMVCCVNENKVLWHRPGIFH